MKTFGGIISVVLLVMIMVSGISLIFNQAATNVNLNEESINLISRYDGQVNNYTSTLNTQINKSRSLTTYEPDASQQGDEIKEYFDNKNRIDQLRDTLNLAYKFPDLLFLSIPFVDYEETALYRGIVWFMVFVSIFFAIILALKGNVVENN